VTVHIAQVPTPLATSGSSIATVIRQLTHQHGLLGGRTSVAVAANRDLRIPGGEQPGD
jgi:hypothetical protein